MGLQRTSFRTDHASLETGRQAFDPQKNNIIKYMSTYHEGVCAGLDCVDDDWHRRQFLVERVAHALPDVGCHLVTKEVVPVGVPGDARHDAQDVDAAEVRRRPQRRPERSGRPSSRP